MTDILNKDRVDITCQAYNKMEELFDLIDDLKGGTLAMRQAGEKWLPKEPKEDAVKYNNRLNRSILYPAYEETAEDLASRPFSKPVIIQGALPENLAYLENNCDEEETNIAEFAKQLFDIGLDRGLFHILIDYPRISKPNGQSLTISDEQKIGARPYFVIIKPDDLISWRTEKTSEGKIRLSQIRWKNTRTEADGTYGEKIVNEIRVMTTTTWEVWIKGDDGKYTKTDEGNHTYPDGIPLVTGYFKKTGRLTAKPPLLGLAWMNLAHWQGYSDQKNLIRYIRFPIPFFKGVTADDIKDITVGPGSYIWTSNPNGDAKYLEHSGAAAGAGRLDLQDIEERMTILGLEPLFSKPGNQTATGQAIDESRSQSCIQAWVRVVEQALRQAFVMAGTWIKTELPADFKIDIYNDFGLSLRATTDIQSLIAMRLAKELSRETFLREIKRRSLISETLDIQEEEEKIQSEGPALGTIGSNDLGGMSDEELLAMGVSDEAIKAMRDRMAEVNNGQG
jgi:hypothetical protein